MYNPMMNPNAGQERLNEMIAEAAKERRNRQGQGKRSIAARVRNFVVKTFSLTIR